MYHKEDFFYEEAFKILLKDQKYNEKWRVLNHFQQLQNIYRTIIQAAET